MTNKDGLLLWAAGTDYSSDFIQLAVVAGLVEVRAVNTNIYLVCSALTV